MDLQPILCIDYCAQYIQPPPPLIPYSSKPKQAAAPASGSWQRELLALFERVCSQSLILDSYMERTINPESRRFLLLPETLPRLKKTQVIQVSL